MHHGMLIICVWISIVSWSVVAQAQSVRSDSARDVARSGVSGITRAPSSSWEAWLNHGAREVTPESEVPPRSPDLGRATAPLSPSIGPGSGLTGPGAGSGPSQLRLDGERDFIGATGRGSQR